MVYELRKKGHPFAAAEIIAKTGWTSGELLQQLLLSELLPSYQLVTLLTGVNNQYRKQEIDLYQNDLTLLVKKAIHYAGGISGQVYVISIPDWGLTPFGKENTGIQISAEIDNYNSINRKIALENKTKYVDITTESRDDPSDISRYVKDQLHYSAKVYTQWTELLLKQILR